MKETKLTIRPSESEARELRKRAKAANMSLNRFMIESALYPMPRNDHLLSELMGQLCNLELQIQRASDLQSLKHEIEKWRWDTIRLMGE